MKTYTLHVLGYAPGDFASVPSTDLRRLAATMFDVFGRQSVRSAYVTDEEGTVILWLDVDNSHPTDKSAGGKQQ